MRTVRTALCAAAAASMAALAVALAGPAAAGGPTSVLLSVPGEGRTASLYYSDTAYAELSRLVGVDGTGTTGGDGRDHSTDRSVTVTWLIHDVQPWRVDRIYLGGSGGLWVQTQTSYEGSIWDAPTSWSRPAEPKALLALLQRLGLEPGGTADGPQADQHPIVTPAPQPLGARTAATTSGAGQPSPAPADEPGTPWTLLAVTFLAGAAATAATGVVLSRRVARPRTPDEPALAGVEVAEVAPSLTIVANDAEWSPAEELVTRR